MAAPNVTATSEEIRVHTIRLETDCDGSSGCRQLVESEYVDTFYSAPTAPLSVAELLASGDEYQQSVSKVVSYNARLCVRRGYRYERIDRADWEDDLWKLRSSTDFRQGRHMPASYLERQRYSHDVPPECKRHGYTVHGVVGPDDRLAAYCQLVQCGEVVRVNTILGHWDRLRDSVVWLLLLEALRWHVDECGARFGLYYTHDSGHGLGLRYFKERFGFRPSRVVWAF